MEKNKLLVILLTGLVVTLGFAGVTNSLNDATAEGESTAIQAPGETTTRVTPPPTCGGCVKGKGAGTWIKVSGKNPLQPEECYTCTCLGYSCTIKKTGKPGKGIQCYKTPCSTVTGLRVMPV